MGGMRIGGAEDSGLDRFQALREQALRRMRRGELQVRVAELEAGKRGPESLRSVASKTEGGAAGLTGLYAQAGATERTDPKPHLGRILDIMA